ncbi:hypothetical protein [Thalassobacillus sp. C254]|uniref:hypothetical protein n=1 Tax=Thalassobacillus sp. C254 TaxID=1225341 RepID=UPI0006D09FE4|nr:hypothetical protein [Thalassobacillus sp. C254]
MKKWLKLVQKEFKTTQVLFYFGLVLIGAVLVFAYFLARGNPGTDAPTLMLIFLTGGLFMHVFYAPAYLFINMQQELKTLHLWLHTPRPGWQLLAAKITAALTALSLNLFVNGLLFLIFTAYLLDAHMIPSAAEVIQLITLSFLVILGVSTLIAMWVLFYYSVYFALRRTIGRLGWIAVILVVMAISWVYVRYLDSAMYAALTSWGAIELSFETGLFEQTQYFIESGNAEVTVGSGIGVITLGLFVYHAVEFLLLFLFTSWLIDKKAEV